MKNVIKLFCALGLVAGMACSQQILDETVIKAGTYQWKNSAGCTTLIYGSRPSYSWDERCDGSIEFTTTNVSLVGTTLKAEDVSMEIENVSADSFSGTWEFDSFVEQAQFNRI